MNRLRFNHRSSRDSTQLFSRRRRPFFESLSERVLLAGDLFDLDTPGFCESQQLSQLDTDRNTGDQSPQTLHIFESTIKNGGNFEALGSPRARPRPPREEPREYKITDIDVYSEYSLSPVAKLNEGEVFHIDVAVEGPFDTKQTLTVTADLNFSGSIEANERFEIANISGELKRYRFNGIPILDDGPWPGNGTASDNLEIKVYLANAEANTTIPVLNLNPRFVGLPTMEQVVDENGFEVIRVSVQIADPGIHDFHTVTIDWDDEVSLTTTSFVPTTFCGSFPGKMYTIERRNTPNAQPLPLKITVHDDDLSSSPFTMLGLDLLLNNDDDNQSGMRDLEERGVDGEDDIRHLDLRRLISTDTSPETGTYILHYDMSVIRVWDSVEKNFLIHPYGAFVGGPGDLPDIPIMQYTGQSDVYVEGFSDTTTTLSLAWISNHDKIDWQPNICDGKAVLSGSVNVRVWTMDMDVDSDNDNGFDSPEFDDWEEYLEASPFALGKLIEPNAQRFTPVTIDLPNGIDFASSSAGIIFSNEIRGRSSGEIQLWRRDKNDPRRTAADKINLLELYQLADLLAPDLLTGRITLYMEVTTVFLGHDYKVEIDAGKPDDRLVAMVWGLAPDIDLKDEVKWMAVNPASFYPTLNASKVLRNAGASEAVYDLASKVNFAQKYLTEDEVRKLIGNHLDGVLDGYALGNVMNALFGPQPGLPPILGLKAGIYWDHAASNPNEYVLAFAGTEDLRDWITNVLNFVAPGELQYLSAMTLVEILQFVPAFDSLSLTGHSLGGGLASAAAVAINVPAVTFNASGFPLHTLEEPNNPGVFVYGEASVQRYHNSQNLIDNFVVYFEPTRRDVPDILTWIQGAATSIHTPLGIISIPHARGEYHEMEGLYNFTVFEELWINESEAALAGNFEFFTDFAFQIINWLTGHMSSAFLKMEESHRFPSIYYGLLHNGQGINIYDGQLHND